MNTKPSLSTAVIPEVTVRKVRGKSQYRVQLSRAGKLVAESYYNSKQAAVRKANDWFFTTIGI